jgi:hypothetical protein
VDNWVVSYTGAGFELYRKVQRIGSGAGETVHITESEDLRDVLKDLHWDQEENKDSTT